MVLGRGRRAIEKKATRSAKKEVFNAVVSAVSVTPAEDYVGRIGERPADGAGSESRVDVFRR